MQKLVLNAALGLFPAITTKLTAPEFDSKFSHQHEQMERDGRTRLISLEQLQTGQAWKAPLCLGHATQFFSAV